MKLVEYFSNLAMPLMIIIIVLYGVIERKKVFDIFLDGAKEGIGVVFNIFPTLVGLFVAIGALRSSGIIDMIVNFLTPNGNNLPTITPRFFHHFRSFLILQTLIASSILVLSIFL